MATPKWTVTVDGKKVTRRSEHQYLFAIVGTRSYEHDLARAQRGWDRRTEESNYHYGLGGWRKYAATNSADENARHEAAQAKIEALGSFEAYRAANIADSVARVEARKAAGEFDTAVVLGWSRTDASATKTARSHQLHGWKNLHLVPAGGSYVNGEVFLSDGTKVNL